MQETKGIKSIEVNEHISLEIAYRQLITYLDYNNGKTAIRGFRLVAQDLQSHSGYTVGFELEALGVKFAEELVVDVSDISASSPVSRLPQWKLLPNPFLGLNETATGQLKISICKDGTLIKKADIEVDLAPMSVWMILDIDSAEDFASLASFSVPSNSAIPELTTKARHELEKLGGSPTTRGYQIADNAEKILEVKALFNALKSLNLEYSNPPASYIAASQRIRTPKEVLASQSATCLDTALLCSSVLEAMHYHPVLAVIPGHAFIGVWLKREKYVPDLVAPVNSVALELEQDLIFFETTLLCRGSEATFEDAVKAANTRINESLSLKMSGDNDQAEQYKLVDVSLLKLNGNVKPIPDRVVDAEGNVTVIESVYTASFGEILPEGQNENPALRQAIDDSPARVKVWKESLLDLTFFNPLLEMTRGVGQIKKGGFKILPPTEGPGLIEDLLQSREVNGRPKVLELLPLPATTDSEGNAWRNKETVRGDAEDERMQAFVDTQFKGFKGLTTTIQPDVFTKRLKALSRAARATIEETGVNSLYITFGSLTWERLAGRSGSSKSTATSPLLLLPVTITPLNKGQQFAINLDETNAIATNETLAIKLLNDYGIDLPKLRVPDEDASGFDVPGLIAHVREVLGKSKYTSWRVDADCSIGFYDFSTYHQWKDLNDNWRKLSNSPLVEHLISKSHLEFEDPARNEDVEFDLDLEASKVPVETDESQIRAIARSLNGESFVIQGPPGTGKSQTITNLLARNLQEGRRVLFVCEKAAALEVVKSRLESVGLGDFVLDLHGSKTKPAEVRARLNIALEAAPDADDTGLETAKYDHDMALNGLLKYPGRLHNIDEEFGTSVYDARDRYLAIASEQDLALDRSLLRTMKLAQKQEFSHALLQLKDEGAIAGNARKNPWSLSGLLPDAITLEVKDELRATLEVLKREGAAVANAPDAQSIINQVTSIADFDALTNLVSGDVMSGPQVELSLSPVTEAQIIRAQNAVTDIASQVATNAMTSEKMLDADVDRLRLVGFEASQANFLIRNKKLDAFAFALKPYVSPAFPVTRENAPLALDTIAKFKDLATKTAQAVRDVTVLAVPSSWNPLDAADRDWFLSEVSRIQALKTFLDSVSPNSKSAIQKLLTSGQPSAIDSVSAFAKGAAKLFKLLAVDDESLELWLNGRSLLTALNESLPLWFANASESDSRDLTRWARVIQILKPLKDSSQGVAYKDILQGTVPFENVALAFERSYYKLVFEKLLDDNDLGNFEGPAFDRNIATFGEAAHKLRGFNRATMAQQIVDARTFDGRAGVGKAGQLKAELQKRSNTLPVRQLMKRYWDTITEITPCIAASPDSVARFLDVNHAKFDLVVFDEASQIRVATAIGALGRANSAIIVGDSKQMPPTSFFAAQYDGDEDLVDPEAELPTQDEESILSEAVRAQIPSTMLTWHYRSQDEALIAFSNKEYYEGKLSSFPSPTDALDSQGVKWVRLEDGFYIRGTKASDLKQTVADLKVDSKSKQKFGALAATDLFNTNPVEAMAVVAEIRRRLSDPELNKHSMGVVTMNENQKKLIDLLLDDVDDALLQEARNSQSNADYIFVRALEKVQGDERDVILMSIGFSRDATGKVPLNFGPLSRVGGERRLNVAVTRARQQVVVFCSFEPEDLKLKETSARGMKDLQGYLSMAKLGPRAIGLGNGGKSRGFDRHRHDVAKALSDRGYAVTEDLGLSGFRIDIAVSDPNDPTKKLMAIMLDGRAWSKRAIASDRDVLPVLMLQERMGWPLIERVWLPTWMRDREGELDRLVNAIKQAELDRSNLKKVFNLTPHTPIKASGPEPIETLTGVIETPAVTRTPGTRAKSQIGVNINDIPEFAEFLIMPIGVKSDLNSLEHPAVKKAIREFAEELTELEGPVSPSRFASLVAKSFDLNGVKSEKAFQIAKLPEVSVHKRDREGFIFPSGVSPDEFTTWKRQESGQGRDLQDISLNELANAMRDLCARVHGMPQAELFRQVSLAFGRARVGAVADARLSSALALGLKLGFLRDQDDLIEAVTS
jgi:Protein of unknown function (DUF4011)/AAA domain/REase_MTES_1575